MAKNVLEFYVPCSDSFLTQKIAELSGLEWDEKRLIAIQTVRNQIKTILGSKAQVTVDTFALQDAIRLSIIEYYFSHFWFDCFENQCRLSQTFMPYPSVPILLSKNGELHSLWLTSELKEVLLQLWLYCDQNEARFNHAVEKVWQEYRNYSRYECGFAGEANKVASSLKKAADLFIA
ncbi:hypothetical protein ACQ4M3_13140 [Leptolyngbya sp. AN03gr2]|uniref:hypothetical protein n=1 Tax=unclassified Leptolyngbya TaxID=2650499 RepID=UPI003D30FC95